ncbi:MAG: acyl-CoA thioesterase [Oscillospiraceae bacterium]|nr:acyl-CoA thioesterase [Oscillospiraceae bacterium]
MVIYERTPHYYETDQMKIVHHSNYIRWFEEARVAYLDAVGIRFADQEAAGIVCPVLTVDAKYIRMVRFGDTVEITTRVNLYNGLRWGFSYEVRDKATGELCCTGTSTHCFLDTAGKIIRPKREYLTMHELLTECLAKDAE